MIQKLWLNRIKLAKMFVLIFLLNLILSNFCDVLKSYVISGIFTIFVYYVYIKIKDRNGE